MQEQEEINLEQTELINADEEFMTLLGNTLSERIGLGVEVSYCNKKNALKFSLTAAALPAGIPFIGLARAFAQDNAIYGYLLASGTVICYANVCFWSYMGLTDELAKQTQDLDRVLNRGKVEKVARLTTPFILGTIAAVPSLYMAYKYNDSNYIWPVINLVSSFGYRAFGFDKGIRQVNNLIKWHGLKDLPYQRVKELIHTSRVASRSITALKALHLNELMVHDTDTNKYTVNIQGLIDRLMTNQLPIPLLSKRQANIQYYGKLIGCALPISQIALNLILSMSAYDLISTNILVKIPLTALTMFPDSSLLLLSAISMVGNSFDLAFGAYNGSDEGRNVFYYNMKMAVVLIPIVLLIASFSYGANGFAIRDNFSSEWSSILLPLFILADTFFHVYVLTTNASHFIENVTELSDNTEKNDLLLSSNMLEQFSQVLEQLPQDKIKMIGENVVATRSDQIERGRTSPTGSGFYKRQVVRKTVDDSLNQQQSLQN